MDEFRLGHLPIPLAASERAEEVDVGQALSRVRLKRVSSRLAWGLLVWGSSPVWHIGLAWPPTLGAKDNAVQAEACIPYGDVCCTSC